jgi:glycosyltransferase involved in cell wall biosynthesis
MFETDAMPVQWRPTIEGASRLWVPSAFNLETFVAGGVPREMIDLVPLGLEVEHLALDGPTLDLPERRAVAFVSVFEWTYRKGWDILLRAWAQAFTRNDDVCLLVRTSFRALDIEVTIREFLQQAGFDPSRVAPIVVIPKKLSQANLAALYRTADAYILPTRGEGFGLPYLEAMALGLPVIGTAWSGITDFVDARTGYLIDARLVPITSPLITRIVPIYKDQRWAEPSVAGTVAQMRRVFEQRDEARAIGARGTAVARTQFNRTRIGRLAAAALERVEPKRRTQRAAGSAGRVTFAGDLYTLDGIGADARGLIDALDVERFELAVPWDGDRTWIGFVDRLDALRIKDGLARDHGEGHPSIVAAAPKHLTAPAGARPSIARTVATAATLQPQTIASLREFDELWVPSQFSVDRFVAAGIDPQRIVLVPQAIDADLWTPQTGGVEVSTTHSALRLITLVDWSARSGWDIVMTAFMRAFEPTDDVSLSVKIIQVDPLAKSPNFQNDFVALVERAMPHRASLLSSYPLHVATGMTQGTDFARYCSSFDVLICPAREVGWGRAMIEAMANGTAVVAPRFGNHRAFTTEENAFLYDATPTNYPTHFEPNVDSLIHVLRRLYERRDEIAERAHIARREIVAEHSLPVVGAHLRRRLERHVERPFTIAGLTTTLLPEPPFALGIVVDARFEPEHLERGLDWIERMTSGPRKIAVVGGPRPTAATLGEAFALLADQPYVAYLRSDVVVGRSWDDFLIDALRTRPRVGFVAARSFDVPGFQGQLGTSTDPSFRDIEAGGFTTFARTVSLTHTGHGTVLDVVSTCCIAFERGMLLEALERTGSAFDSVEPLVRATLTDGRIVWCAQDAIVRHGGSGMKSLVELRRV